eukprot:109311_1
MEHRQNRYVSDCDDKHLYCIVHCVIRIVLLQCKRTIYNVSFITITENVWRGFKDEDHVESTIKDITNHYYAMMFIPIRRAMIIDTFGPDLGVIIASYLPNDDEFDVAGNLSKAIVV